MMSSSGDLLLEIVTCTILLSRREILAMLDDGLPAPKHTITKYYLFQDWALAIIVV
jgi:hypothetical protein